MTIILGLQKCHPIQKHILILTEIFLILKRIQTPQPVPILQLDA